MLGDIRIDLASQAIEVGRFERLVGFENEYPFRQKQLVFNHVSSSYFVPCRYRFVQPLSRHGYVSVIEVSDHRFRERLAECRHALLPLPFPDHGESLDIGKVCETEFEVLPRRASFPAVEAGHIEQHAQLSVLPDESLELGYKVLAICFYQLPEDVNDENLPAVFFIEVNRHWALLRFVSGQCVFHVCSCLSIVGLVQAHASFPPAASFSASRLDSTSSCGFPAGPGHVYQCIACAQ